MIPQNIDTYREPLNWQPETRNLGRSKALAPHRLAGRSSACFFDTLRAGLPCGAFRRGDLSEAPRPPKLSRLRMLIGQGLIHSLFFSAAFVVFPALFSIHSIVPKVSHEWAISVVRFVGLRSVSSIETAIRIVLNCSCLVLLFATLCSFLLTAAVDPGRVPRRYHWVAAAARCAPSAPLTTVPPSQRRLAVAQTLGVGVNDLSFVDPPYHSSSFSPALHGASLPSPCHSFDFPQLPPSPVAPRPPRLYFSFRSARAWQALLNDEEDRPPDIMWSAGENEDDASLLKELDYKVPTDITAVCEGVKVKLKWCVICRHVRSPRTRHCTSCHSCVDRFDHHCVWVCNCVGLRNHRYFMSFISSASALNTLVLVLCLSLYHELWSQTYHLVDANAPRWWVHVTHFGAHHWIVIRMIPVEFVLLIVTLLLFFPFINLVLFHTVLLATNRTTTEEMRELYLVKNPFDLGFCKNIGNLLFGAVPPSLTTRWGDPRRLRLPSASRMDC
eukprot:Protomagalhaensia_sp_Gyna_25__717@NODE_1338_length_1929_cov_15_131746_g1070_i0_p1_GENE_NODE_1338_length_1929_cov_15_131746_g1070_i0NODE_1338_length_1929_cov_15_131746_g1070_i0_p1_ORF_typecomplete_len499_score19_11DHHC/PF01529_20/1e03DHHC/PF01529_20/4_8e30_NODE_1338_length_1929_cov_15_131746_g1070_i03931889